MSTKTYNKIILSVGIDNDTEGKMEQVIANIAKQTVLPDIVYIISIHKLNTKNEEGIKFICLDPKDDRGREINAVLGALQKEPNVPGTLIVTMDAAHVYSPTFLQSLVEGAEKHPGCAVGFCGHIVGRAPFYWAFRYPAGPQNAMYLKPDSRVNVLAGWGGCAYPRNVFNCDIIPDPMMDPAPNHPDLYMSCWLYRLGVPKYVIAYGEGQEPSNSPFTINIKNRWFAGARSVQYDGLLEDDIEVPPTKSATLYGASLLLIVAVGGIIVYELCQNI